MNKVISLEKAVSFIKDCSTLMVGGFLGNGTAHSLIDALIKSGVKNLTLICNDTAFVDTGVGKIVAAKQCSKIITSHIGTNKETGRQMSAGETEIVLTPQGTLAEQIRAAGFGLGGILTPTGLGTMVEEGKTKLKIDGKDYILEKPIFADVAILYADKADKAGNLVYRGSGNNFNNVMAAAAKITIVEAGELVEVGDLDPISVMTPGIFVNYIVRGANNG